MLNQGTIRQMGCNPCPSDRRGLVLSFLFLFGQVLSSKNSKPAEVTLGKEALHKNRLFEWCTPARGQVWYCSLNDNPFGGGEKPTPFKSL